MDIEPKTQIQIGYDRLAREYADRVYGELEHKPLDRTLLDRFADRVRGHGLTCDLGCGPGHIAAYLHGRGLEVIGVDVSAGMLEQARRLNPEIEFVQGDMLALKVEDNSWAGIAAFYSIIHIPRDRVVQALAELKRVLRPGGLLLLSIHIGNQTLHVEELWGQSVSLDFEFFETAEMERNLVAAGFVIEEILERDPYPDVEYHGRRAYFFAIKP